MLHLLLHSALFLCISDRVCSVHVSHNKFPVVGTLFKLHSYCISGTSILGILTGTGLNITIRM